MEGGGGGGRSAGVGYEGWWGGGRSAGVGYEGWYRLQAVHNTKKTSPRRGDCYVVLVFVIFSKLAQPFVSFLEKQFSRALMRFRLT